jgi:hypothetical protein
MKAVFTIKVTLENRNVETNFGTQEAMEDLDLLLLQNILKVLSDVPKKVKQQVDRYYAMLDDSGEMTEKVQEEEEVVENPQEEKTE